MELVKGRDAILDLFMKPRGGKSEGMVFRPGQVDLAIVIDHVDYILASENKEKLDESDNIHHKVRTCNSLLMRNTHIIK